MPPLFGLLAEYVGVGLLPWILLATLSGVGGMFVWMEKRAGKVQNI
jgi:hypothetical protein